MLLTVSVIGAVTGLVVIAACSGGARLEDQLAIGAIATQRAGTILGPPQTVIHCGDCERVDVVRVIDGDSIDTGIGRVRFYGVDAPERDERCFDEASEFTSRLAGVAVRVEEGPRGEDQFGRLLRYVYDLSGNSIEVQLVAGGFARAPANDGQHAARLAQLEQSARANYAGCLWPVGG